MLGAWPPGNQRQRPGDTAWGECSPRGLGFSPDARKSCWEFAGPRALHQRAQPCGKAAGTGGFSGTYPGAVACSPAHLAGWDQPRGPGVAALETGKPTRSCWRASTDWILTPTCKLAKEASAKCGTLKATWFSMLFCSFIRSFVYSFTYSLTHRVHV